MSEVKPLCIMCGTPLPSRWRKVCATCQRNWADEEERREAEAEVPHPELDDEDFDFEEADPEDDSFDIPDGMKWDAYHGWYME